MIQNLKLKHLGPIKNADVDFADLTIICGKNSVGKTYLSYTHYLLMGRFYEAFREAIDFPTLRAQCEAVDIEGADIVKVEFELNINQIEVDIKAVQNEVNSLRSKELVVEQLQLGDDCLADLECHAQLYGDFLYDLKVALGGVMFALGGKESKMDVNKEKDSEVIQINLTIASLDDFDEPDLYSFVRSTLSFYICSILLHLSHRAISSERTGISLFYKDLDSSFRDSLVLGETEFSKIAEKKYSLPIEDNIRQVRNLARKRFQLKRKALDEQQLVQLEKVCEALVGGEYISKDKEIHFSPVGGEELTIGLKSASGAAKSLVLIDAFVQDLLDGAHFDMLIIDEPELNLHLDAQKKIAQLLAALTNLGIKVVVTTHSDHFIREINNLIALSSVKISEDRRQELLEMAGIEPVSILKPKGVSAVVIEQSSGNTKQMPVSELGIELSLFNDEIMKSMDISNEIAYAVNEGESLDVGSTQKGSPSRCSA